jgi:hypothetical protein
MGKHTWMIEVLDDLAFYAVSNDLSDVSKSIEEVRQTLIKEEKEPVSNVLQFEALVNCAKR